jgi:hypothetical protein
MQSPQMHILIDLIILTVYGAVASKTLSQWMIFLG